jgi:phosphoserine phosphatase
VETAGAALPGAGPPLRIGPGAADIPFTAETTVDQRSLAERLRGTTSGIDIVVQPAAARRKKLFLADMDSTMIRQECIDELADYVGLKAHVAAITERAMRGDIAFEPALRERVALLEGLPISVIEEVLRDRISLTPGGKTLVATMRANGAVTCMVSGGFTLFTDRIAAMIGFDKSRANRLTLLDGHKLAGKVADPVFGRDGKRAALIELRRTSASQNDDGVGDGAVIRHDLEARSGRGVPCQTENCGHRPRTHRSRRSHGAALCSGISPGGICRGVIKRNGRENPAITHIASHCYCKLKATKLGSPSGVTTNRTAAFLPSFLSLSTRC